MMSGLRHSNQNYDFTSLQHDLFARHRDFAMNAISAGFRRQETQTARRFRQLGALRHKTDPQPAERDYRSRSAIQAEDPQRRAA